MDLLFLNHVNLKYFDGNGAGAGSGAEGGETGPGETGERLLAEAAAQNHKGEQRTKLSYETDQPEQAEEIAAGSHDDGETHNPTSSSTLEEKRRAYDELINGEYKDFYTQDTQNIINRRFKETKDLEAYKNENSPIIDMLMQKYGAENAEGLLKAIENDTAYWEEAADEAGMSVSQYMEFQRLERENKALLQQQESIANQQKADAQYAYWTQEAEQLKAKYPGFDLMEEAKNQDFVSMLASNVPMEQAFKVIHMDEIMDGAIQAAMAQTQKAVTDNIRARGSRPQEAGLNSSNAIEHKVDVDKLTGADLKELARRAERGEIISF